MRMKIDGMACSHCAGHVSEALNALRGVNAQVDLETGQAFVTLAGQVSRDALRQAVENAGYTVRSFED